MSIKFCINNVAPESVKEGELYVRYSGTTEIFKRTSERDSTEVNVIGGHPVIKFNTGLDSGLVEYADWLSEEGKKELVDQIKELRPGIVKYYRGEERVKDDNISFWGPDNQTINKLKVDNSIIGYYYDTEKPEHALLYLSIMSGAFNDLVAPNKEWAIRTFTPHYLSLSTDNELSRSEEESFTRSDAHAALSDLRKNHGKESLYMIAWCIQPETNAFGAYSHSVTEKDLVYYHMQYIDGKLLTKNKKSTAKNFISYYDKWLDTEVRANIFLEAYVKAGDYFSFINQREKKYVLTNGTILGNTVEEAIANLKKPKFRQDYELLKKLVTDKWNE